MTIALETFKSGEFVRQKTHQSFVPAPVNDHWTWTDPRIGVLLEQAARALGTLGGIISIAPNLDPLIGIHLRREAHASWSIEGDVDLSWHDMLPAIANINPVLHDTRVTIERGEEAITQALDDLKTAPLSNTLLRATHAVLFRDQHDARHEPGQYRSRAAWIDGESLQDAVFIPPPPEDIPGLMDDLEAFRQRDDLTLPLLIRLAIAHYQFETIHPFARGNGRLGRMMILLSLMSVGILEMPLLGLSTQLLRRREAYYDALTTVRASHDMGHWICFFLSIIRDAALDSSDALRTIISLRAEAEKKIAGMGRRSQHGRRLLAYLLENPVVTMAEISSGLSVTKTTATALLDEFTKLDLLGEATILGEEPAWSFTRFVETLGA